MLGKAASEVGGAGKQVGELTTEVRKVSDALGNGRAKRQASPIEVLLSGLTKRR